jgi:amidase
MRGPAATLRPFDKIVQQMKQNAIRDSGAFIEQFTLEPTASGLLDGLTFAVKDLIDVAGHLTGCGNPTWRTTHPPAVANAVCVEQILAAGARCLGKTITDELAYSLLGENFFYGTPLNPRAPDRVPGGSSSGSASAVACGAVDFAFGTDTGGSVRVPASNCGIWGMRPTHGIISLAGVSPLAPGFDTVGILACSADILHRAMSVLLSIDIVEGASPEKVFLLREAFDLCDPEARKAIEEALKELRALFGERLREISIREIDEDAVSTDLMHWNDIYRVVQRGEAMNCLGGWVESTRPAFGHIIAESVALMKNLDRQQIPEMQKRREDYFRRMRNFLGKKDLLCIPTASSPAPYKGSITKRDQDPDEYYPRTLCLTSIAGVSRAPQISMPVAEVAGAPFGLSLIGRTGEDAFLLAVARLVETRSDG